MIGWTTGIALAKTAFELWQGKPDLTGGGALFETGTKGLKGSRTVKTAATVLAVKVGGVFLLPLPTWLQYAIVGAFFAEFIVQLYLRVITRGPV